MSVRRSAEVLRSMANYRDPVREPWGLPEATEIRTVVQPIVRLDDRVVIGYEALARVSAAVHHGPDWWLERAAEVGLRSQLEVVFLESAARLGTPPEGALLFVNASPAALAHPDLLALRTRLPERLVVEITEQVAVDDYLLLREQLEPWVTSRVRLAIDDTGAGYSSLRHVVELSPDFLKLDRTLVHDIDKDPVRRALVRALVAFAREVGTSVIAEGVETAAELAAVIAAEVPLAQGFLIARPGPAWPHINDWAHAGRNAGPRDGGLSDALAQANDVAAACDAVVAHLFRQGQVMPSLYLERNGQLRCVAQRGLWQVLDGLPSGAGITGQAWATGKPVVAEDVSSSPEYLEAIPGVVAEVCVPVTIDGITVGALNIDSLCPLPAGSLRHLQDSAAALARRLGVLGWRPDVSPWHRAERGSVVISGLAPNAEAPARILTTLLEASGMDSAGLVVAGDALKVHPAVGILAPTLERLASEELLALCGLVDRLSSCYTGRETTGLAYVGSEALRASGARAVLVLPLRANNRRLGTIILAHSRPLRLAADVVEPLELLAGQAAALLNSVSLVERLRRQAYQDGLTGLGNRMAFELALEAPSAPRPAVLIADLDYFKQLNDRYGHLVGDEALRSFAAALEAQLPGIPFYRFGGDELACLIPGGDVSEATRTAEAVCDIGRHVLSCWQSSVSVGVALASAQDSPADTLAHADAALLWTKQHARGNATTAPARPPGPDTPGVAAPGVAGQFVERRSQQRVPLSTAAGAGDAPSMYR